MKKIVFCLQTMVLGGVEKELISVLKQIHNKFDITLLLLYSGDSEIMAEIPDDVHIRVIGIDKDYYCARAVKLVKQRIKKGKLLEAATIATKRCLKIGMTASNTDISDIAGLDECFDVAICYHIHSPLALKYTAQKIKAKKKIAWIHNDFYTSGYPISRLKKYVQLYDEFVSVSKKVEKEFRSLCPWYQGNISTAYNYMDFNEIIELSKCDIAEDVYLNAKNKILTVGRFSKEKGIDLAIIVASMLKEKKIRFHWFLIGCGDLEDTYRKLIDQYDVSDSFTILGRKSNPYPYIKKCDICVQPSRHEAYPLVIMEAKILNKPIICTDFDGADEQITNGENGIIVPLNDTAALFQAVSNLIQSPDKRDYFSKELEKWSPGDDLREIVKHFE